MKKILAVLLSVLCIFSMLSVSAFAIGDIFEGVIGDYVGITEEDDGIDAQMMYGIHYKMDTITNVSIMYMPNPTITFKQPVTAKVTTDTPLSVDYQFVCWKHGETGELYYPGDPIEVTGAVTLYAVWEEKSDSESRVIRVITTALETLKRLIQQFLGIIEDVEDFESEYYATTTAVFID